MKKVFRFALIGLLLMISNIASNAQALTFDGVNDVLSCGNDVSLQTFADNEITLEAWINASSWRSAEHEGTIVAKEQAYEADGTTVLDDGYILRCGGNGEVNVVIGAEGPDSWEWIGTSGLGLVAGTWIHLAAVYDGTSMILYVDGVEVLKEDKTFQIGVGTDFDLTIGNNAQWTDRAFAGSIDEVRVWNVARTATQISDSYEKELTDGANIEGLIAYYKMNEGSGTSVSDYTSTNNTTMGEVADTQPVWTNQGAPVTVWTSVEMLNMNKSSDHFYPNPVEDMIHIKSEFVLTSVSIFNIAGQMVKEVSGSLESINVEDLSTGLYFIQMDTKAGSSTQKMIKK